MLARTETISVLVYPVTYNLLPYPFTNNYIIINKHEVKPFMKHEKGKTLLSNSINKVKQFNFTCLIDTQLCQSLSHLADKE